MKNNRKTVICCMILASSNLIISKRKKKRKRKSVWVKDWLRERPAKGAYQTILVEMKLSDAENFRSFLRMNTELSSLESLSY